MEKGRTYWIFAGEEIKSFVFDGYDINGDALGSFGGNTRILFKPDSVPLFSSREALCEHYRKIFE